jgi:hypothetical protein
MHGFEFTLFFCLARRFKNYGESCDWEGRQVFEDRTPGVVLEAILPPAGKCSRNEVMMRRQTKLIYTLSYSGVFIH